MANDEYFTQLQNRIGYKFKDVSVLERALIAPGAEGNKEGDNVEREKYDGNRKLAKLGDSILHLIVVFKSLYEEEAELSIANDALKCAIMKENHEKRAKFFKIDSHIKLSPRQKGQPSTRTLSLAVCAIFGACFWDSNDISAVRGVVERFGIGIDEEEWEQFVDPITSRSQEHITSAEESASFSEFSSDVGTSQVIVHSPPTTVNNNSLRNGNKTSIETHSGLYSNGLPENPEYSILSTRSRSIDVRSTQTPGHGDNSAQSLYDIGNIDDENFHGVLNQEQTPNLRSNSASPSRTPLTEYFPDHGTRNGNPMSSASTIIESFFPTQIHDNDNQLQDVSEDRASPVQSLIRTREPSSNQRAGSENRAEKRMCHSQSGGKSISIEKYILLENGRCETSGIPCLEEGFNSAIAQDLTTSLKLEQVITELKIFYFAIASPESLAALKTILKAQRRSLENKLSGINWNLPPPERMKEIESLNEDMAQVCFLRRCHTFHIFVESSLKSLKSSDGFFNLTSQSISTRANPKMGNPINLEDSRVSERIMRELYPNMNIKGPEYEKKLRFVKKLRKLGQRFEMLVDKFGYGILGLLPLAIDVPAVEPVLNITDTLILKIPDEAFRWFVQLLDKLQGNLLREASKATISIVMAIFQGHLDPSEQFGIEQLEEEVIIRHPKGSPSILERISRVIPRQPMQPDFQHPDA